jgi:hypothetical protein
MTEDEAARALPTCPATYMLRDGVLACTTCGALVGGTAGDQVRHSTWHTTLAAMFVLLERGGPDDAPTKGSVTSMAGGKPGPGERDRPEQHDVGPGSPSPAAAGGSGGEFSTSAPEVTGVRSAHELRVGREPGCSAD